MIVLDELCLTCSEPLIVMGEQAYCTTCQPHLSFVVGYENAPQYSYTRVDPHQLAATKQRVAERRRAARASTRMRLVQRHRMTPSPESR